MLLNALIAFVILDVAVATYIALTDNFYPLKGKVQTFLFWIWFGPLLAVGLLYALFSAIVDND